jgi:hypothetical protein
MQVGGRQRRVEAQGLVEVGKLLLGSVLALPRRGAVVVQPRQGRRRELAGSDRARAIVDGEIGPETLVGAVLLPDKRLRPGRGGDQNKNGR